MCVLLTFSGKMCGWTTGIVLVISVLACQGKVDGDEISLGRIGRNASLREQRSAPEEVPAAGLTNVQLLDLLTNPAHYDKHQRPLDGEAPVNVSARAYIYLVQSVEGRLHLQLKLNMKLQLGFRDPRLEFSSLSPQTREVAGGAELLQRVWTPHVFVANERYSFLMSSGAVKDVLVRLFPDGNVLFITRLTASVICSMKGRFPFDQQYCPLVFESWLDDSDDLVMRWAADSKAVTYSEDLSLSSFTLQGMQVEEHLQKRVKHKDQGLGRFGSSYWSLELTFSLARLQGFFIMDYYLPSVLLVVISWVSFWLEPDMIPARVLLGSSTMLTFITLAVQTDKSLPVSYVKASEMWFVGCCTFIFGSLVEFAFVNTIWRQGQSVELKKVNTRHILKSTLGTPRAPRRRLLPQERYARRRTSSLPDLFQGRRPPAAGSGCSGSSLGGTLGGGTLGGSLGGGLPGMPSGPSGPSGSDPAYYATIHGGAFRQSSLASVSESSETLAMDDLHDDGSVPNSRANSAALGDGVPGSLPAGRRQSFSANFMARLAACRGCGQRIAVSFTPGFTRMSAQEVSDWIDRRSRVFFPLAFLVFNCVYWTSVWFF